MVTKTTPDLIARITLYATEAGGRKGPIVSGEIYRCPCKFHPNDVSGWDCGVLTNGERFSPGETKELGIIFLTPEIAPAFRLMPKFYLWEGRIIGEATVLTSKSS